MAELYYVGPDAAQPQEIESVTAADALLNSADITRAVAQERINLAVATRAAKTYVDSQDETYAESTYHTTQNNLLIPNASKGVAGGVASLDGSGKIPSAQAPILGSGVLRGPFGPSSVSYAPTTGSTPAVVAQWNATNYGINGWPMVFMNISCSATDDRTVVEVRIGTPTQTAYTDQTLVARGFGRARFKDYQTIAVMPVTAQLGESQDGVQDVFGAGSNWLINAWMYNSGTGSSSTQVGQISTAALYWVLAQL